MNRFKGFVGLALDFKLGGRMLVKYPGLTIIGGLAMAFGICVGAVVFAMLQPLFFPTLPLPEADRIVQIRSWDIAARGPEKRILHDFLAWRGALRTVTELGAWRDASRNLIVTAGDARPVKVAEITASAFRAASATPLLGRALVADDERAGAPAVAVIGHTVWQTRFGSDPNAVGRTVQLGNEFVTVVGVMREEFEFPVSHDVWTPLRIDVTSQAPRSGPGITVFGLLAPGVTIEMAQAELTTLGGRAAIEQPATHQHLQPQVRPYAQMFVPDPSGETGVILFSIYAFAVMLLVLICGNVALLLFARAATRETELVVRTALGASRSRIVGQLFAEALVLGGAAAVAGLAAAHFVLRAWGTTFLETNLGRLPFWVEIRVSPETVLFALALTLLGSAIAGVLPALKVTRGMGLRLKQATAGAGGLQFGGIWTAVIIAQVAVTVAFPALVYFAQWTLRHIQTFDAGFAAEQYLSLRIDKDAPTSLSTQSEAERRARRAGLASSLEELRRRVTAEAEVAGVTFVSDLPRTDHPQDFVELVDDLPATGGPVTATGDDKRRFRLATIAAIEPSYFDVLEAPILAGRAFSPADVAPRPLVAIVDQGFVDQVLQGRNAVGQRLRFSQSPDEVAASGRNPWIEIVGVVTELGMGAPQTKGRAAGLYLPAGLDRSDATYMMVHLRTDPMAFVPQLRDIATAVDPTLRLSELQRLDKVTEDMVWIVTLWLRITAMMTAVALLLSLSGIYAVLSFVVARRTREIGVRVALGASSGRVIAAIFKRPLIQVGLGVLAGGLLIAAGGSLETEMPGLSGDLSLKGLAIIVAYATLMLGVCLFACVVPTRRALSVEPTVALRID